MSTNHWHIVVRCKTPGCIAVCEFADARDRQEIDVTFPAGPCFLDCPVCHQRHEYTSDDLGWIEKPTVLNG
jgi:hypothetical protein